MSRPWQATGLLQVHPLLDGSECEEAPTTVEARRSACALWGCPARSLLASACALSAVGCWAAARAGGLVRWQGAPGLPAPTRSILDVASASNPFLSPAESLENRTERISGGELPEEWEVIFSGGLVNVRTSMDIDSEVRTVIKTGTVVLGFQEGDWLRLAGMPGYMALKAAPGGDAEDNPSLLRRREVSYLLSDGSCESLDAYPVTDPTICKHAARMLGESPDSLWFKSGCQLEPGRAQAKSEGGREAGNRNAEVSKARDHKPGGATAVGDEETSESDEIMADASVPAAENTADVGGAMDPGSSLGRRLGRSAEDADPTSWEAYSKGFKTLCSTRQYDNDLMMPVHTATSVTTTTLTKTTATSLTTTQTTVSTTLVTDTPSRWGSPSLFCFAVFRANTPEQDLVKEACRLQSGIFACDTTVTISGAKVWVGKDKADKDVYARVNQVDEVTMGDINNNPGETTNSWLNTQIFINAIDMLVADDIMWKHDWMVKGDPDAVLFPDRIRKHINEGGKTGTPAFYENCFHDGQWWLYGSIEIFSREAMEWYRDKAESECKQGLPWKGWGEDYYMDECMKKLGVASVQSESLVGDQYCSPKDCTDGWTAVFHPFKTRDDWRGCLEASTGLSFPAE